MKLIENIYNNDINGLIIMENYIFFGILLVFVYVIILKLLSMKTQNRDKQEQNRILKKNSLYLVVLILWALLCVVGFVSLINNIKLNQEIHLTYWKIILLVINLIFISYFWLNGLKDLVYMLFYSLSRRNKIDENHSPSSKNARIIGL